MFNLKIITMKFFNSYSITRLRNQEFPAAYSKIVSVLEKDEIAVEYVERALEKVKVHNDNLVVLRNMTTSHHLSKTINDTKHKRHNAFLSLRGKVTSALKSPSDDEREAAKILDLWLSRYRKSFLQPSIHEESSVVREMMDEVGQRSDISSAIDTLGALSLLDSLQAITTKIDRDFMTRHKERTENSRKAHAIKRESFADLKMLFNSVEMAITLKDGDSTLLMGIVQEVNGLMDTFKAKYQSRVTRKKNAAEENQNAQPENGEQDGEGDMTALSKNGKPAMPDGMKTYGAKALDGMDLQNGTTNGSLDGKLAMNGSETNGAATDGAKEKDVDLSASNGGGVNNISLDSQEDATKKHEGASNDDSDRNRGMNNLDS